MGLTVRGLEDEIDGAEGAGVAVWADELKLEQVLLNLVGNALDAIAGEGWKHDKPAISTSPCTSRPRR